MRKIIVIMFPTVNIAVYKWKAFLSRWSMIIKKANRSSDSMYVELSSGHKIYFKVKTAKRERALRGLRADAIVIDEFEMQQEESEDKR